MSAAGDAKSGMSGVWTRISARIVLMLGFAYAASWWADQRFYSHFGIAPQDIGLTPSGGVSDIIGAIVRLGLWIAIALVALGLLPVLAVSAAGFAIEVQSSKWKGKRALAAVFAFLASVAAFLLYASLAGWIYAAAAGAVLITCTFFWWLLWPARPEWHWRKNKVKDMAPPHVQSTGPEHKERSDQEPTKWTEALEDFVRTRTSWAIKVLDVFSIIAVIGLLLVDLPDDASRAANCVVKTPGYAVKGIGAPVGFVHLILLDVYAQPATITWIGDQQPSSIDQNPFRGIYLGTSGSTAIIYEPDDPPRLLRLPAGNITETLSPTAPTCKEAH